MSSVEGMGLNPYYRSENERSFPVLEQDAYGECRKKIEELKEGLVEEAKTKATQKTYSEEESFGEAFKMIVAKNQSACNEILNEASNDLEKKEIINYAWKDLQAELFSPFGFMNILMDTLRGQSSS